MTSPTQIDYNVINKLNSIVKDIEIYFVNNITNYSIQITQIHKIQYQFLIN